MLKRENIINKNSIKNNKVFNFQELSHISKINLRGNINDKDFIIKVEKVLKSKVPIIPNTSNNNDKLKIIWLGPNEWLIEIYDVSDFDIILRNLKESLNTQNTAITDVTENRIVLQLSGSHLYKLLSKFMIIDLEKALEKESSVAQTIFVKLPVLIIKNHKKNEEANIYLHVNRSHAQYIIDLLIDGSQNINF